MMVGLLICFFLTCLCQVWLMAPPTAWSRISLGSGLLKQLKLTATLAMILRMMRAVSTVKTGCDRCKNVGSELVSPSLSNHLCTAA